MTKPHLIHVTARETPGPDGEEAAFEQACRRANANAKKMARALGVRLIERAGLEKEMQAGQVCVRARYLTSPYRQWRLDAQFLLRNGRQAFHYIRKELSTLLFRQRYAARKTMPPAPKTVRRALVAGHFSIPGGGGTFGDVQAQEVACQWLAEAGYAWDVASNGEDGVTGLALDAMDASLYDTFVFVCGPWYPERPIPAMLLEKFAHCKRIGLNLTVKETGTAGFDHLLARDNPLELRADLAFARQVESLPVVGVLLVDRQLAYGNRQRHVYVRQVFEEYAASGVAVPVYLDTVIHGNQFGLKTSQAFESLLRKVDVLITNRLHGLVLGLKNGVPVVAVDAIEGGGKVTAQAAAMRWPVLLPVEELDMDSLHRAVESCLAGRRKGEVEAAQAGARASIARTRKEFMDLL